MIYINNLLLPDTKTKKRAFLVRHHTLLGYILVVLASIFTMQFISTSSILGYATDINIEQLLEQTNQRRAEADLEPLVMNETLSQAAKLKAQDMFEKDYWAHTSPTGKEPWDFIKGVNYDYLYAGENLAVDFAHSKSVVTAWYNSPSHRDNLLNEHYTEIGFAIVNGELEGRETTLVVQMFGKPRITEPMIDDNATKDLALEQSNQASQEIITTEPSISSQSAFIGSNQLDQPSTEITQTNIIDQQQGLQIGEGRVLNSSDVFSASKYMALILGLFVTGFFAVDGYFVRRYGTLRISGHTFLHVSVLLLALIAVWYTSIGIVL